MKKEIIRNYRIQLINRCVACCQTFCQKKLSSKQGSNNNLLNSYTLYWSTLHCSAPLYQALHCIASICTVWLIVMLIISHFERKFDKIGEILQVPDLNPTGCIVEDTFRFKFFFSFSLTLFLFLSYITNSYSIYFLHSFLFSSFFLSFYDLTKYEHQSTNQVGSYYKK